MLGIEALPAVLYFFALYLVPRSPRWLMMKEKFEEALNVMKRTAGPENGERAFHEIKEYLVSGTEEV